MPRAEVYRKSHSRVEDKKLVTYVKGDELDATDRELKAFSDRLRLKGADNQKKSEKSPKEDGGKKGSDGGGDQQELIAAAKLVRETDDVQQLREIAYQLSVDVNNRWGTERTRDAIIESLKERGLEESESEEPEKPEE